jgi:hypothetical protein
MNEAFQTIPLGKVGLAISVQKYLFRNVFKRPARDEQPCDYSKKCLLMLRLMGYSKQESQHQAP